MKRLESLQLPNTITGCHDRIQELSAELTGARAQIEELEGKSRTLEEKVRDLMHRLFGTKSERQVHPPISDAREEAPARGHARHRRPRSPDGVTNFPNAKPTASSRTTTRCPRTRASSTPRTSRTHGIPRRAQGTKAVCSVRRMVCRGRNRRL